MNLDELRTVQSKERQKGSLQNLRPSFYKEVGDYIADLEAERDRVADAADDPFSSPEVGRLTDEIETAKDVVEAIYERRMGKLVKQASLAAAGMPANDDGLTAEEADLFDDLVDRIRSNKGRVLDVLEGVDPGEPPQTDSASAQASTANRSTEAAGAGAPESATADDPPIPPDEPPAERPEERPAADHTSPSETDSAAAPDRDGVSAADVMGGDVPSSDGGPASSTAPESGREDRSSPERTGGDPERPDAERIGDDSSSPDVDRMTVRITRDVGAILGVDDREYSLASDDVVTLPEQNAAPLVERDAAEPIE